MAQDKTDKKFYTDLNADLQSFLNETDPLVKKLPTSAKELRLLQTNLTESINKYEETNNLKSRITGLKKDFATSSSWKLGKKAAKQETSRLISLVQIRVPELKDQLSDTSSALERIAYAVQKTAVKMVHMKRGIKKFKSKAHQSHLQAIEAATRERDTLIQALKKPSESIITLITTYEREKDTAKYNPRQLSLKDREALKTKDTDIQKLIQPHKDKRAAQLAKTIKPALVAMKAKLTDLESRVKTADAKAGALATPKNLTLQVNARVAHATANAVYDKFDRLYQDYANFKITLAEMKKQTKEVLTTTPWKRIDGSGIDASTILTQHRGNQGKRTWAQWAHEFLKGLGATTLSQFFKPATAKRVDQYVAAVEKEKDNPKP